MKVKQHKVYECDLAYEDRYTVRVQLLVGGDALQVRAKIGEWEGPYWYPKNANPGIEILPQGALQDVAEAVAVMVLEAATEERPASSVPLRLSIARD